MRVAGRLVGVRGIRGSGLGDCDTDRWDVSPTHARRCQPPRHRSGRQSAGATQPGGRNPISPPSPLTHPYPAPHSSRLQRLTGTEAAAVAAAVAAASAVVVGGDVLSR